MWSEIFTHDFENGEKVAIILLDTQGVFDSRTSIKDSTTIFTLSLLLSSVQCYNVKEQIKEDILQHLDLFTGIGRIALEQTNEMPFQKLIFIVRDWPFAYENEYGWQQNLTNEIMNGNDEQTTDMIEMRNRIKSSFKDINTFLMPFPGVTVAQAKHFNGNLTQIDSEFIKYLKVLVPSLLAPENLVLKEINGQKVRAQDLIHYLQAYINLFSGDSIPNPVTTFTVI